MCFLLIATPRVVRNLVSIRVVFEPFLVPLHEPGRTQVGLDPALSQRMSTLLRLILQHSGPSIDTRTAQVRVVDFFLALYHSRLMPHTSKGS
jgi:hypothetical protein